MFFFSPFNDNVIPCDKLQIAVKSIFAISSVKLDHSLDDHCFENLKLKWKYGKETSFM